MVFFLRSRFSCNRRRLVEPEAVAQRSDAPFPTPMMVIVTDYVVKFTSSSSLSSRRCVLWQFRPCWFLFMAFLVLCFPISMKSRLCADGVRAGCIFYGDFGSSVYDQQSFEGSNGPADVCPCSCSFFQSVGILGEDDDGRAPSLKVSEGSDQTPRNSTLEMAIGDTVSCYMTNSASGIPHLHGLKDRSVAVERLNICDGSPVLDICIKGSSERSSDFDEHLEEEEAAAIRMSSSSLPEIEVRPPMLDWGTKNLYSPSLAILKVINKHNESDLNVYDLFSTNTQFDAYSFQKFSLAPGGSASIPFVFLPRWLGSSSAQLVLQTSFGGFIIRAKGIATTSPYQLQAFTGFNISTGRRLNGNLSIYNPSTDVLHVKEVETWISISDSMKDGQSAHVSCSAVRFQKYHIQSDSPIESEGFSLRRGELGSTRVDFRPHQQWDVHPYCLKTILELDLWPHVASKIYGAICMKLGNSSQVTETVVLPIDIEVRERESYTDSSGSFSLYFDTLSPCNGKKTVFSVFLRNDASYLLNIVNISEETSSCKIFKIRYTEGLLLFPGTVTQIALLTYDHPLASKDKATETHSATLNCLLSIKTNDSVSPDMSIPCHDLVSSSCVFQSGSHNIESESSYIKLFPEHENAKYASIFKPKSFEVTESGDLALDNWRSQATSNTMSVLEDQELLFPVVQVGSHYSKWISVHNPSQKPIVMQLVLNSGSIVDHCKSNDKLSEHTFMTQSSHIDSGELRVGFSVPEYAVTEAFVHPLESALFGPVIFRPSDRCMWRSFAMIRSNLSGVEWLPLQAFGGSQALVILEDSVPILNLDFDLHVLKTSNVSSIESSCSFCSNLFSKELFAKNIGDLPLEIIKLTVSGTDCGSDGFKIHSCEGFHLAPGESRNLLISYQSDFSTAVVHRDLELSMATGILVIPMKASVPVYILGMCRKAFFRSMHWKLLLLLLLVPLVFLHLMIRIIPQINTLLHQDARNSRSLSEDEKFEAAFFKGYPESTHVSHDNTKEKLVKDCFDHQERGSVSPQVGNNLINQTRTLDIPGNCNLTVRVVRDKGRRRKRRSTGAGLASKFEVSSSQSGNSTPTSPLSPYISTPKQSVEDQSKEHNNSSNDSFDASNQARKAESAKCCDRKRFSLDHDSPSIISKLTGKPNLLSSSTFPGPGLGSSSFLASTSSIAPCARAPGSRLCREESVKEDGNNDAVMKDFTYDIWGNHFSEHMFSRTEKNMSKLPDASEQDDSYSFFTRDPQSPMMMSMAMSASPGP